MAPPLPLEYNFRIIDELKDKFHRIDEDSAIPFDEFRKGVSDEKYKQCIPLIEVDKGRVTLSAIGIAIWEKYKEYNPPLPPKSTRPPDQKDHMRELKQEPARTEKFERFREKLRNCEFIDEFWYLKGCNPKEAKVETVGNELHIYYDGIVLRAKTTAKYLKQLEYIKDKVHDILARSNHREI